MKRIISKLTANLTRTYNHPRSAVAFVLAFAIVTVILGQALKYTGVPSFIEGLANSSPTAEAIPSKQIS